MSCDAFVESPPQWLGWSRAMESTPYCARCGEHRDNHGALARMREDADRRRQQATIATLRELRDRRATSARIQRGYHDRALEDLKIKNALRDLRHQQPPPNNSYLHHAKQAEADVAALDVAIAALEARS
jgi:hypothetical protein